MNAASHKIESSASGCSFATKTCENEIVITRLFNAPREPCLGSINQTGVYYAMVGTEKLHIPLMHNNNLPGGDPISTACDLPMAVITGVPVFFGKFVKTERIVCTDSFSDEKGNVVPATYYGMSPRNSIRDARNGDLRNTGGQDTAHPAGHSRRARWQDERFDKGQGWNESLDESTRRPGAKGVQKKSVNSSGVWRGGMQETCKIGPSRHWVFKNYNSTQFFYPPW